MFDVFQTDNVRTQQLNELGMNLNRPCVVQLFFFFPKPDGAEMAAQELRAQGYATDISKPSSDLCWCVLARGRIVPTTDSFDKSRNKLDYLAARFGGAYDGWGIPLSYSV